ncbi:hypothetical protein RB195_008018 [Necator americanus]|uniref:Uncharacterized protein n=1 Tax=Necator americanus TaxID=51031 RepID=A0ABR1C017_NECAM
MLMDGEDVMMISVEETPGTSNDEPHETSVSPRRSSDLHRSEDEFGMDQPSTSELKLTMQPTRYPDAYLQEILLSSPAHLFSCGLLPPEHLTASWEQWLCYLASSLTPHQWQSYWAAHAAVFGLGALPVHLCSFFNRPMVRDEVVDRRHLEYVRYYTDLSAYCWNYSPAMGNAATTQSQSRKDYYQGSTGMATVYSNGRAAAAASERSEWSPVCMLP